MLIHAYSYKSMTYNFMLFPSSDNVNDTVFMCQVSGGREGGRERDREGGKEVWKEERR